MSYSISVYSHIKISRSDPLRGSLKLNSNPALKFGFALLHIIWFFSFMNIIRIIYFYITVLYFCSKQKPVVNGAKIQTVSKAYQLS